MIAKIKTHAEGVNVICVTETSFSTQTCVIGYRYNLLKISLPVVVSFRQVLLCTIQMIAR